MVRSMAPSPLHTCTLVTCWECNCLTEVRGLLITFNQHLGMDELFFLPKSWSFADDKIRHLQTLSTGELVEVIQEVNNRFFHMSPGALFLTSLGACLVNVMPIRKSPRPSHGRITMTAHSPDHFSTHLWHPGCSDTWYSQVLFLLMTKVGTMTYDPLSI